MATRRVECPHCGSTFEADASLDPPICPKCRTAPSPSPMRMPTPTAKPDALLGTTLGDFEIVKLLGHGGMGTVYKARQPSLERFVAIKVLSSALASDASFVARFAREARAAAAVNHRNIIAVVDIGQARGFSYIAMEYVDGESLATIVRREGHLAQERALEVMEQVASALAAAHEAGVIHRDIKPSNIMINSRGEVRITDFGLAKRLERDIDITEEGQTLGTPAYLAPEVVTGGKVDGCADLYSLGATFYHLLAGRPPFEGATFSEVVVKQVNERPLPLGRLAPWVDPRLCQIIDRLLQKSPAARFPSAQALLDALEAIGPLRVSSSSVTATLGSGTRFLAGLLRRAGQKRALLPAAAAVGVGLLAAIVLLILHGSGTHESRPAVTFDPAASGDPREVTADALFEAVRRAADLGQWDDARASLARLDERCADTPFYAAHRVAITELRLKAEGHLHPKAPTTEAVVAPAPLPRLPVLREGEPEGPAEGPPAGGEPLEAATVPAPAAADWLDTGLYLAADQRYALSASGRWGPIAETSTGPEGKPFDADRSYPVANARVYTLIARIGPGGPAFAVGSDCAFIASKAGRLRLRMNVAKLADCWGALRVAASGPLVARADAPLLSRFTRTLREVKVDSRADWAPAGIDLRPGERLLLTAKGTCYTGGADPTDADGRDLTANGHRVGALLGRIGASGAPFAIGTLCLLEPREGGSLFLVVHDISREDNQGGFTVTIAAPPEPPRPPE